MSASAAARPGAVPPALLLHVAGTKRPAWAESSGAAILDVTDPAAVAGIEDAVRAAECVLVNAAAPHFVGFARRVHAVDPAVQVVAVAEPSQLQATRRALLYAPGLGEVWIASPTEVNGALAERAAGVTRQRRAYEHTRLRLEGERHTMSPQRNERALISDAYLASLLRVLPDAVFSVDAGGRILSANATARRMFGDAATDLTGAPLDVALQLVLPARADLQQLLQDAAASEQHIEVQFRTRDGRSGVGELLAASMSIQGMNVWAVILRDVTEHHEALEQLRDSATELEAANEELQVTTEELAERTEEAENIATALRESELSFRALADAIPTLAWTARPDGYIDWYNKRWYDYTGARPEEMEGDGWHAAHHPDSLPRVMRAFQSALATGKPLEMTFPLRGADGTYRTFLTRMVPVTDAAGNVVRWFGTNTDVQVEHEARAVAEEARARADEANRAKSQFLANMSHELRTPLNAIGGHIQLIEMELHGPVTGQQRDALARVQRAQEHLLGLINDVLNFAKLESGRVEYEVERIAVRDLVADVVPLMEPQFAARGVGFGVDQGDDTAPLHVCGDRDKIRQVLLNLLSNAAKFTPRGGAVRLGVRADGGVRVAFVVADDGPGIPPDRTEAIFEPFVQLRAPYGPSNEGTGLGLAISRDLARGMKGDITVAPADGGGSIFTLVLPVSAPADGAEAKVEADAGAQR